MKTRERWFLRWAWIPIHWKGWAFIAIALPLMLALLKIAVSSIGPDMSLIDYIPVGLVVFAAVALNIFVFRKS